MGSNEWCASNLKSHIDIATRCVCIGGMTSDPKRGVDEAGGKKPHGHVGWFPPWQAIPHPRPGPAIHRGGTWGC